jgi:hypothetical protein
MLMTLPRWDDPKLRHGTMVRTALWLMTEVGVGNTFTKARHRQAFTGVTQADRRLRDLRDYGWVIRTSTEDLTLRPDEQRFVAPGKPVWDRGIRKDAKVDQVTAKQREAAFSESDYQCVVCGIAGGERYPDASHVTAVLSISRREVAMASGEKRTMLVAECKRCRAGGSGAAILDVAAILAQARELDDKDLVVLLRWMESGRRQVLDHLWSSVRRLPLTVRNELRNRLDAS